MIRERFDRAASCLAMAVVITVGVLWMRAAGRLQALEFWAHDYFLRHPVYVNKPLVPPDIFAIRITSTSGFKNKAWPDDDELADLIDKLVQDATPIAIGIDLVRPGTTSDRLKNSLKAAEMKGIRVVVVSMLRDPDSRHDIDLKTARAGGFGDVPDDPYDGVIRRAYISAKHNGADQSSFALLLAERYLVVVPQENLPQPTTRIGTVPRPGHLPNPKIGWQEVPRFESNDGPYVGASSAATSFILDYKRDMAEELKSHSVAWEGKMNKNLANANRKVVIIGYDLPPGTYDFAVDQLPVPVGKEATSAGMYVQAAAVDQLIRMGTSATRPVGTWSDRTEGLWIVIWGFLPAIVGYLRPKLPLVILLEFVGIALIALVACFLLAAPIWIPVAASALAWGLGTPWAALTGWSRLSKRHDLRNETYDEGVLHEVYVQPKPRFLVDKLVHREPEAIPVNRANPAKPSPILFISYAHQDNASSDTEQQWLNRVVQILHPLQRASKISIWTDTRIQPGNKWLPEIQRAVEQAKIAVVLLSPALVGSDFIWKNELPAVAKRASDNQLTILFVVVRPCDLLEALKYPDPDQGPNEVKLTDTQFVNAPSSPLTSMIQANQDQVLVKLVKQVRQLV